MTEQNETGNYAIYLAELGKKNPIAVLTKVSHPYAEEIVDTLKTNRTIFCVINPFDAENSHFGLNNPYYAKDIRIEELPNNEARKLKGKLERRLS